MGDDDKDARKKFEERLQGLPLDMKMRTLEYAIQLARHPHQTCSQYLEATHYPYTRLQELAVKSEFFLSLRESLVYTARKLSGHIQQLGIFSRASLGPQGTPSILERVRMIVDRWKNQPIPDDKHEKINHVMKMTEDCQQIDFIKTELKRMPDMFELLLNNIVYMIQDKNGLWVFDGIRDLFGEIHLEGEETYHHYHPVYHSYEDEDTISVWGAVRQKFLANNKTGWNADIVRQIVQNLGRQVRADSLRLQTIVFDGLID